MIKLFFNGISEQFMAEILKKYIVRGHCEAWYKALNDNTYALKLNVALFVKEAADA